ncbi:MAG: site-specific integrase, partial [Eubacteriales bacterium]|nr:site-specific integrase [Eubacteriales bacterium]
QSGQYLPGKGIFTKEPKNETSKRVLTMPKQVMYMISQLEHEKKLQKVALSNKWMGGIIRTSRLFTQANGLPIFPGTISKQWKAFIEDKNLPILTFHGIRHTSASYLIACGQDVVSVSKRLGHASSNTTLAIYAHAFKKRDQISASFMEGLYSNKEVSVAK